MTPNVLSDRTKKFAIRVVEALPRNRCSSIMGMQLLRCGTSVGANYRAACRARSTPDFISKMTIVEEECDEVIYWIELLVETENIKAERVKDLLKEASELVAIVVTSVNTARAGGKSAIRNPQSAMGATLRA